MAPGCSPMASEDSSPLPRSLSFRSCSDEGQRKRRRLQLDAGFSPDAAPQSTLPASSASDSTAFHVAGWICGTPTEPSPPACCCSCSPAWSTTDNQPLVASPTSVCPTPPVPYQAPPVSRVFRKPTPRFADRFVLTGRVLGSGQFGTVQECANAASGERFACKTVTRAVGERGTAQAAELRNEVGTMLLLRGHDNLVQLRGVFEDPPAEGPRAEAHPGEGGKHGRVHLVMDLCEGGELFQEIACRRRLSEEDAAATFSQIAQAVAFCHSRGVVHRDLKPENILFVRRLPPSTSLAEAAAQGPVVKLVDLGLAVPLRPGQAVTGPAGSPLYMAPEVHQGPYGFKADVWSLGVILYILLCGAPPFWGPGDKGVFAAVMGRAPDLHSRPWDEVSESAKGLVRCLLHKDPACRPAAEKILTHPWVVQHTAPGALAHQAVSGPAPAVKLVRA